MKERKDAILSYLTALKKLKDLNIIKNQKDFTSHPGEWLVAEFYEGEIAINGKQKDWDVKVNGSFYQVKTHSKADTTKRSDTDFKYSENANIDYFIILVFNENYKLEKFFKIPWKIAFGLKTNGRYPVIRWKDIPRECEVNIDVELAKNELLSTFIKIK